MFPLTKKEAKNSFFRTSEAGTRDKTRKSFVGFLVSTFPVSSFIYPSNSLSVLLYARYTSDFVVRISEMVRKYQ